MPQLPGCVRWRLCSTASLIECRIATRSSTQTQPDRTWRSLQYEKKVGVHLLRPLWIVLQYAIAYLFEDHVLDSEQHFFLRQFQVGEFRPSCFRTLLPSAIPGWESFDLRFMSVWSLLLCLVWTGTWPCCGWEGLWIWFRAANFSLWDWMDLCCVWIKLRVRFDLNWGCI